MINTVKIDDINYSVKGNSKQTVVLLHGYLESKEMWAELSDFLSEKYKVICIDLPGHGKTKTFGIEHSMEFMADIVNRVIEELKINKFLLVGHSMGGYVSLAFAEKYVEKLSALVMFHSHVYSDDDTKKTNRNREIKLVQNGNYKTIVDVNIPNMYATNNLQKFANRVEFSKNIALNTPEKGVIAALNGMKNRKDRFSIVANTKIPILFLPGKFDNLIAYIENDKQYTASQNIEKVVLNSGHMGMFEDKEKAFSILSDFIAKNIN